MSFEKRPNNNGIGKMLKVFFSECQKRFIDLGLIRTGQTFARVVGDVFQTFTVQKIGKNRIKNVRFAIVPLCANIISADHEMYYIDHFDTNLKLGWELDADSEEQQMQSLMYLLEILEKIVINAFREGTDCKKALSVLNTIDDLFVQKSFESLKNHGIECSACQPEKSNLLRYARKEKYYMALKIGDYDFAEKYLNQALDSLEEAKCIDLNYPMEPSDIISLSQNKKHLSWIMNQINQTQTDLFHVKMNDDEFFRERLANNERASRKLLAKYIIN